MSIKLPQIIGHRGCAAYAPENTITGIHTAADMGLEWVELDIKLSKDQVPILFHDSTLERTTDASGNVADFNYSELRNYDAGLWFGESFFDTRIASLEQAIDALIERELGVNFEIKPCEGREVETAEVALDMLSQYWDDHKRILISSFSIPALEVAADMAQDWPRGLCLGSDDWPDNLEELVKSLELSSLHIDGNYCTQEQIEAALNLGLPLAAFTINDADKARQLQSLGIRSFFCDDPDALEDGIFMVH